jgi:hypothetical protein
MIINNKIISAIAIIILPSENNSTAFFMTFMVEKDPTFISLTLKFKTGQSFIDLFLKKLSRLSS